MSLVETINPILSINFLLYFEKVIWISNEINKKSKSSCVHLVLVPTEWEYFNVSKVNLGFRSPQDAPVAFKPKNS